MAARVQIAALLGLAFVHAFAFASQASAEAPTARPGASSNIAAACPGRDPRTGWADPAPPAHLFGGTWYVGTCGITALLVETSAGLVLLDGGVPEAAPLVLANIRKLGFNPRHVRWILVSHEHFDHAGALRAIQRATGARVVAGPFQRQALSTGRPEPDDPQIQSLAGHIMEPLVVSRTMRDNGRLTVGNRAFTAAATPAHSPGSTSWTWRDCEGNVCQTIAYADSTSTVSSDSYRFLDHPQRIAAVRSGLQTIGALPCDIMATPHPAASDLLARMSGLKPLVQPAACRVYAQESVRRFDERLASEAVGAAAPK